MKREMILALSRQDERRSTLAGCVACMMVLAAGAVLAQDPSTPAKAQPAAKSVQTLIQEAYGKTKSAKTAEEYGEIIALCEEIQAGSLSAGTGQYIKKLLGWTLTRRGEALAERASTQAAEGQAEQAERLSAQALADFDAAVQNDPTYWKALHNRGVSYAQAGKYDLALADFDRALELKPDYANTWFNRAEVRYAQAKYEDALRDYGQSLLYHSGDFGAYTSRGHTYFQLRRFREALDDYSQAVSLNSGSAIAYANRGDAYQSLGQWQRAAADYRRALELDGGLARTHQSLAWLLATCPDGNLRNSDRAIQAAEKAIELAGNDNYRYLDTLAAAYASAGRYDEAQTTLAEAIELAREQAAEQEVQRLEERKDLYGSGKPYRQGSNP